MTRQERPTHAFVGFFALLASLALFFWSALAKAAPEAHILRVDPRAAQENGNPILTTVIEVVQTKRVANAIGGCSDDRGSGYYRCISSALEQPYALYQPFPFPQENAVFTIKVDDSDQPASYVSHT